MTEFQESILNDLKNGAKLQCNEGRGYQAWLVYPDGTKKVVRRDSANKLCVEHEDELIFGEDSGIRYKSKIAK